MTDYPQTLSEALGLTDTPSLVWTHTATTTLDSVLLATRTVTTTFDSYLSRKVSTTLDSVITETRGMFRGTMTTAARDALTLKQPQDTVITIDAATGTSPAQYWTGSAWLTGDRVHSPSRGQSNNLVAPTTAGWRVELGDATYPIRYWDGSTRNFSVDNAGAVYARSATIDSSTTGSTSLLITEADAAPTTVHVLDVRYIPSQTEILRLEGTPSVGTTDLQVSGSSSSSLSLNPTGYGTYLTSNPAGGGSLHFSYPGVNSDVILAVLSAGVLSTASSPIDFKIEQGNGLEAVGIYKTSNAQPQISLGPTSTGGSIAFGPGVSTAPDVHLSRTGAGSMGFDGQLDFTQADAVDAISVKESGDSNFRLSFRPISTGGSIRFGSGSGASDVRLDRTGAGNLTVNPNTASFLWGSNGRLDTSEYLQMSELGSDPSSPSASVRRIYFKSGGLYMKNSAGTVTAVAGTVTRSLYLPGRSAFTNDSATNVSPGTAPDSITTQNVADAATQGIMTNFTVPGDWVSGAITYVIYWAPSATDGTAHTVRWSTDAKEVAAGSDVTAAGTTTAWTGSSATRTINLLVLESSQTLLTPSAANNLVQLNIRRLGADAADTYVGDVRIAGVRLDYTAST